MTELTPLTEAQDAPAHGDIIWITGASSGLGRGVFLRCRWTSPKATACTVLQS